MAHSLETLYGPPQHNQLGEIDQPQYGDPQHETPPPDPQTAEWLRYGEVPREGDTATEAALGWSGPPDGSVLRRGGRADDDHENAHARAGSSAP